MRATLKLQSCKFSSRVVDKNQLQYRQLCLIDLQRGVFGFWKFSFIQALPPLEELLHDGAVWVDDLEAGNVGPTRKDPVQTHVGKPLRAKKKQKTTDS